MIALIIIGIIVLLLLVIIFSLLRVASRTSRWEEKHFTTLFDKDKMTNKETDY